MNSYGMMLPAIVAVLLCMPACSVKEDRNPCPCLLELDINGPEDIPHGPVEVMITSEDGLVISETLDAWWEEGLYSVSVPRTDLHVSVWAEGGRHVSEKGLRIPLGNDCPRVYMHDSDIHSEGDFAREKVYMRKNHCVLTLVSKGEEDNFSDMILKGNVSGYDEYGQPLEGDFEFSPDDSDGGYEAVLPRQTDDSLMLELEDSKGNHISFSLGRYITASGYDWSAPDLDDVTVTLDYALTEIRLNIDGWESVYRYDIEI